MALIERLMALEEPRISVHHFFAANQQRMDGALTRQNIIDIFVMDLATVTEYDALMALAPSGSTALALAQKAMFAEKIHAVLMLAEGRYAGYGSAAAVKLKLGI